MNAPRQTTVLVCGADGPARRHLDDVFAHDPEFELLGVTTGATGCVEAVLRLQPDVVLLDLDVPTGEAVDSIPGIKLASDRTRVVVRTRVDEHWTIVRALTLGAADVVDTSVSDRELLERVRAAAAAG